MITNRLFLCAGGRLALQSSFLVSAACVAAAAGRIRICSESLLPTSVLATSMSRSAAYSSAVSSSSKPRGSHVPTRAQQGRLGRVSAEAQQNVAQEPWYRALYGDEQPLLQRRLDAKRGLAVFLEGLPGTGKASVLQRLKRMGYTTIHIPFIDMTTVLLEQYDINLSEEPQGTLNHLLLQVRIAWGGAIVGELERALAGETPPKDNVLFVHRSLLSAHVNSSHALPFDEVELAEKDDMFWKKAATCLAETYDVATVMCESDLQCRRERIGGRHYMADEQEKIVRGHFGDPDADNVDRWQATLYSELQAEGWFDTKLYTTDSKQATAAILRLLGIDPPRLKLPTRPDQTSQ
eukprot:CAMPEP_0177657564 /NCGR_PEP_ID=MMETSP0447-20121125/16266_1 /TAXON_ID=0 /ORGANISM="Stygamoeba regulata, Strain BSH-02190019" /LENGTH=349 /DNA_ID=CAMNT_0019161955 /DNA_START=51 /DNA_END=1100 /DNA_ORIENTATION=+